MNGEAWLEEVLARYREQKSLADRAIAQLVDDAFFHAVGPESNSVAVIVKHVAGNLRSRWTEFLTSDGEKADRKRDSEFEAGEEDTRASILGAWENAWRLLLTTVGSLRDQDLSRTVVIRG